MKVLSVVHAGRQHGCAVEEEDLYGRTSAFTSVLVQGRLDFLVHNAIRDGATKLDSGRPVMQGQIRDLPAMQAVGDTANVSTRRYQVARKGRSHSKARIRHITINDHVIGKDERGADRRRDLHPRHFATDAGCR